MIKLNPSLNVYGDNIPLWERGQHGGRTRPINQTALFNATKEVTDVFNQLGIKYCLSHGTALGVRRDGDTIPWDDDVDLAIFSDDRPKLAKARSILKTMGFWVPEEGDPNKPIDIRTNMPWYDFVSIKNGEKVECWIFDKIGKYYIYDQNRDGLTIPEDLFDTLSTIQWRGATFYVPSNVDRFLDLMYGPTWKTPDKDKKYNNLRTKDFEGK
jgi:phosphorylcholine metabolism protein LicD